MVHYIFQYMSTITMLTQNVTQYYKNITSQMREYQRYTIMNSTKDAHELQKKKLERQAGGLKE